MTDDGLEHSCRLSVIWAGYILSDEFDPTDVEPEDLESFKNSYRILARTMISLMKRQGIKPRFRVDAGSDAR